MVAAMKISEAGEREIIQKALEGDEEACTMLVSGYRTPVLSFINQIVPNAQDAEDICQETFQKCFKSLSSYKFEFAFSTWLFTIAQNTALDFHKKRRVPLIQEIISDRQESHATISSTVPSPEENLINEQAFEYLIKSIQHLDVKYRKIAELRFIHDYPLEEIAKELELPLNTVKTRVSRAKKILNKIWKS